MRYQLMIAVASAALLATSGAGMAAYQGDHYNGGAGTTANGEVTPRVNAAHPIQPSIDSTTSETTPRTMKDYQNGNGANGPAMGNPSGSQSMSNELANGSGAMENHNGMRSNDNESMSQERNEHRSGMNEHGSRMNQTQRMAALIGRPVLNDQGQQIGNVVQPTDDGLVIATGQYLGMGQHEVLLRSSHVRINRENGGLIIRTDLSRDKLGDLPSYNAQPNPNPQALYNVPENEASGAAGRDNAIGSGMSH